MNFEETPLLGSFIISLLPHADKRGWFARYYCKDEFSKIGHNKELVQFNHSFTNLEGSIRGLHYQQEPYKEIKLVRCIAGAVFDVLVDLRKGSPSFLRWFGVELSAENKKMVYIPEGFAHGFQTLTANCELLYHHSEIYEPNVEAGIRYDDPILDINWPVAISEISDRDKSHKYLDLNFKGI